MQTGLTRADLSPTTSPLYRLSKDSLIFEGTTKLAVTLGEHPRVAKIVTDFLAINYSSAFNEVLGRPLIKAMKVVTSIYCLTMKFPTAAGTSHVEGK